MSRVVTTARAANLSGQAMPVLHGDFLAYLLNRVVSQLNAPMQRRLRKRGMTLTHWRVLGFLCERDGLIISELADRTVTDQATLSRALDRLEARALIERVVRRDDSRQIEVHLLAAGREAYQQLAQEALALEDWAFAGLSPAQLQSLRQILMLLSDSMRSEPTDQADCAARANGQVQRESKHE